MHPNNFPLLRRMLADYDPTTADPTMSPHETMVGDNYMQIGESGANAVISAIATSQLTVVNTVLDLPCGYGRILRHLVKLFPQASFDACDIDARGVDFCAQTFGARSIYSKNDLTSVSFDRTYDVIWIGSLFTHTPINITRKWLAYLADQLSPSGIIVATFHGRWATQMQRIMPMIDAERWSKILQGYETKGYGFEEFTREQSHNFEGSDYGISLSKPHTIIELIEGIPRTRIFMYAEKGWGHNHDVVAFGKPDWDQATW